MHSYQILKFKPGDGFLISNGAGLVIKFKPGDGFLISNGAGLVIFVYRCGIIYNSVTVM